MSESVPEIPALKPLSVSYMPYWVAVVINGVVYDVMNIGADAAARFLAQPTFVQVQPSEVGLGWNYDGTSFTPPDAPE